MILLLTGQMNILNDKYEIICLFKDCRFVNRAAVWFSEKWGIPVEEYEKSISDSFKSEQNIPKWYIAIEGERIIAGMGVIENDFHPRKDLTPNVCAVYTEEDKRGKGIARFLLDHVCKDMKKRGFDTLYLFTDHTSLYEK